ncbi:hypothetical protein KIW84_075979 [Lathyrus oleraceus]|uniref:Uncharacterized protein n=1 Tax=Pisum sativum TaxID=3888 RepID=A0A9D4ZYT6_PEA|nr:hypothetical protein KIW84_075979 [Pisum sativum]
MPPSRKKPRLLEHQAFPIDGQFSMPTFPNYIQTPNIPIFHLPETSLAGMQGARHDPFGLSLSDLHINESPLGLLNPNFQQPFDHNATPSMTVPSNVVLQKANDSENVSCSASEKQDHAKPTRILLLGQTIQIDPGHENAVKKILNKYLPKRSYGERLEYNTENQCKKDTCDEETVEIEHSGSSSKEPA